MRILDVSFLVVYVFRWSTILVVVLTYNGGKTLTSEVDSSYNVHLINTSSSWRDKCNRPIKYSLRLNRGFTYKALIFTFRVTPDGNNDSFSCDIVVTPTEDNSLIGIIKYMTLRKSPTEGCIDYLRISSLVPLKSYREVDVVGGSNVTEVEYSRSFCGNVSSTTKLVAGYNILPPLKGEIHLNIYIGSGNTDNVSFSLLFTPILDCSSYTPDTVFCPGVMRGCMGKKFACDGVVNCGFSTITDELPCSEDKFPWLWPVSTTSFPRFTTTYSSVKVDAKEAKDAENAAKKTTLNAFTIAAMVFGVLFVCALTGRVFCLHMKNQRHLQNTLTDRTTRRNSSVRSAALLSLMQEVFIPMRQQAHGPTAPPSHLVVLDRSDIAPPLPPRTDAPPPADYAPPSYDVLFPDTPPPQYIKSDI